MENVTVSLLIQLCCVCDRVCVCVLCTDLSVPVGAALINGDFSSGLTGWQVDSGMVSDGGGFTFFEEDQTQILSTLVQAFNLPADVLSLSFDLLFSSAPGGPDLATFPDAFSVSLLNPVTFAPFVSSPSRSDFYFIDNSGVVETIASTVGDSIRVDLTGLGGMDVALFFDLFGGDDGMISSVELDNVMVEVIPEPASFLLMTLGMFGLVRGHRTGHP